MRKYAGPERRQVELRPDAAIPVLLTRKYAERIDGVDLSEYDVGDRVCLNADEARILMAEGWAERAARRRSDVANRRRDRRARDGERCA